MNQSNIEIYRNEERRISPDYRVLRIPIVEEISYNFPSENSEISPLQAIQAPEARYLELNRYRCTFHISYETLEDFNYRLGRSDTINRTSAESEIILQRFTQLMQQASRETQGRLRQMQPIEERHPVILEQVWMANQWETRLIVVNIEFWAIQNQDADLGKSVFERTLHEMLSGSYNGEWHLTSGSSSIPNIPDQRPMLDLNVYHNPYFDGFDKKKYKDNAEENAHELLKKMITKKQFETYKLENYVTIKGTYGRTYTIRKSNMIDVKRKQLGCKTKTYRLCIEPRDRGTICPTDEVVAKIKLIRASEKRLHELANKFDDSDFFGGAGINVDGTIDSISISNASILQIH